MAFWGMFSLDVGLWVFIFVFVALEVIPGKEFTTQPPFDLHLTQVSFVVVG